ncbi:DUF2750 domain-containing protein [Mucilaginibacter sp.]|uniref:DUF2750 domain-containing protein n=1 Tax=Mucilaginibacter sp. TaxID=1882438 RepID=UPI00326326DE
MKVSDKEIKAVSKLGAFERYQYFIKRVADSETMYSLIGEDGNFALADVENTVLFSVWSAPEFALACAEGEGIWKNFSVKEILMEEFEDNIINEIEKNKWLINVFAIKNTSGFIVDLNELAKDLNEERKKYH